MNIDNCNHTDTEKHQEEKIFLYTTITGNLQLIHLEQIGYFRYNSKSKLWEAVLNNNQTLALKRNTNSQKILSLHPYLIQISQSHIINISYLVSIEDNNCILLPPFNEMELLQVSKSFMKKLSFQEGVCALPCGIYYKVLETGESTISTGARSIVTVHYKGSLIDGRVFDNSYERTCPDALRLSDVIEGWQVALQKMHVGDKWIIYIPYAMGYGIKSFDSIPAYSTLIFEVELLGVA